MFCQFDQFVSWLVSPWLYPMWDTFCFLDLINYFISHVKEVFSYNLFKNFLRPFLYLFCFWDPYTSNVHSVFSQRSLRLSSNLFFSPLFCSSMVISTLLCPSSFVYSSASVILLLIPSRVFLISVIALFVYSLLLLGSC